MKETLVAKPDAEFQLFESHPYGESDLLFKDSTQCFVHTSHMDYRSILGEEFYSHAESVFNCTHSGTTATKYTAWFPCQMYTTISFANVFLTAPYNRYPGVLQSGRVQHILPDIEKEATLYVLLDG